MIVLLIFASMDLNRRGKLATCFLNCTNGIMEKGVKIWF